MTNFDTIISDPSIIGRLCNHNTKHATIREIILAYLEDHRGERVRVKEISEAMHGASIQLLTYNLQVLVRRGKVKRTEVEGDPITVTPDGLHWDPNDRNWKFGPQEPREITPITAYYSIA